MNVNLDDSLDYYLTENQINDIPDIIEGFEILITRDLLFKYVNNLDDVKEILRLKYHSKPENVKISNNLGLHGNYRNFMEKLCEIKNHLKDFIALPEFQKELGEIYKITKSQIESKFMTIEKIIQEKDFPIVTIGEAKSGKSTFINMLLNKEILPMNLVSSTRSICEIKNSEEKTISFYGLEKETIIKDLSSIKEIDIQKIANQNALRGYDKAIYKYPVNFLDNYTYLVDCPGIGDNFVSETMIIEYLGNSTPAFIFILNANNSYGLTLKTRQLIEKTKQDFILEANKFISDFTNTNESNEYYFQYHKVIFILNHWDTVKINYKSKEIEDIRKIIIDEIKLLWHNSVKENEQIFFISAKQAIEWQKHGLVQTEIIKIRNCIKNLVVNLYQKNIENSLELLNLILQSIEKKILQKINTIVNNKYYYDQKIIDQTNAEHLCQILENLNREMDGRKARIREQLKPKFEIMANRLTEHLKSEAVENRILNITKPQITVNDNMDILTIVFRKLLETKLYDEIKRWEEENKQMENLYSFLNGLFEKDLKQISDEIQFSDTLFNKESMIKAWSSTNQCEVTNFNKDSITKIEKVAIISTVTLLFPFVVLAGLLATPLIMSHLMKEKRTNEERLAAFRKDPDGYLRNLISSSLQKLSPKDVKHSFFNNVQKKCEDHIKAFETFITIEIEEKRQLIKDIEKEKREIPEILKSLSNLYYRFENYYGEYHNLKNTDEHFKDHCLIVRSSMYEKLNEEDSEITKYIATGKRSTIFKNKHYPSLTFKTYKQKFIEANARFQMQEINLLTKAPHDYILRCKNICFMGKEDKILLVLENVDCNLNQYMLDNPQLILRNQEANTQLWKESLIFIIDVSIKLCLGLQYLHSYVPCMVHPDLRLETVLIRKSDKANNIQVFICDAHMNFPNKDSPKEIKNSLNKDFFENGGYIKEDIYNLGTIIYKLVYSDFGETITNSSAAMNDICDNQSSDQSFKSAIEMTAWNYDDHVPSIFDQLMKQCLYKIPETRPGINECIKTLEEIKHYILYLS